MYRQAKASGLTTSMDPGMPDPAGPAGKVDWKGVLAALLPDVDVFMPSADELLYMLNPDRFGQGDNLPPEELHRLGDTLIGMGAAVSAIKLGKRGMYIRTASQKRLATMGASKPADLQAWADREMWFPIYKEDKFMGATGAGDASIAAFLTALMRGQSLREAGFFAAAVGAGRDRDIRRWRPRGGRCRRGEHVTVSAEDLEKYETEMELALYREYRDVVGLFSHVVETERRVYLCNSVDVQVCGEGAEVYFDVTMHDAWVWDIYRPARFAKQVRVVTFKDVNVEELAQPDLEVPKPGF